MRLSGRVGTDAKTQEQYFPVPALLAIHTPRPLTWLAGWVSAPAMCSGEEKEGGFLIYAALPPDCASITHTPTHPEKNRRYAVSGVHLQGRGWGEPTPLPK